VECFGVDSVMQQSLKASVDGWECKECCAQNTATSDQCVKCHTSRPCEASSSNDNIAKVSKLYNLSAKVYVIYNLLQVYCVIFNTL